MAERDASDLVLENVSVLSMDPTYDGRLTDVRVSGGRVVAVGAQAHATSPGAARRIDAGGAMLVPLMDATVQERWPTDGLPAVPTPGSEADFVVVTGGVSRHAALHQLVVPPPRLVLAVVGGRVVAEGGRSVVDHRTHARAVGADDPRWGTWRDRTGYLDQRLSPDGTYDETRAGRPRAYTGACWLYGDRIVYLDDSGFWAFGRFIADELHHAGFVMTLLSHARGERP